MEIWECIECPRCGAKIGEECVQRDLDDPSDAGQHSDRIHNFIEHGSLEHRIAVHEDFVNEFKNESWFDCTDSLMLDEDELLEYLIAKEEAGV